MLPAATPAAAAPALSGDSVSAGDSDRVAAAARYSPTSRRDCACSSRSDAAEVRVGAEVGGDRASPSLARGGASPTSCSDAHRAATFRPLWLSSRVDERRERRAALMSQGPGAPSGSTGDSLEFAADGESRSEKEGGSGEAASWGIDADADADADAVAAAAAAAVADAEGGIC